MWERQEFVSVCERRADGGGGTERDLVPSNGAPRMLLNAKHKSLTAVN